MGFRAAGACQGGGGVSGVCSRWVMGRDVREVGEREGYVLNAAGTPMIKPLPLESSLERSTLFPGELSCSSTLGIGSPALTMFAIDMWKERVDVRRCEVEKRKRLVRREEVDMFGFYKGVAGKKGLRWGQFGLVWTCCVIIATKACEWTFISNPLTPPEPC